MPRKIEFPNPQDIVSRYIGGMSENKLARALGVDRNVIRRLLLENGVRPRSQSEAETLKWSAMSRSQRAAQVSAAHKAMRGRIVPDSEKINHALSHERTLIRSTPVELEFADRLKKRGLDITPQKAVHFYNLDVAVNTPPVAVEIFGGGFHAYGSHLTRHFKRTKYLLDSGWTVVIVWVDGLRYPLSVACDDYIVKLVQELGAHPPARGQYRVILGNGEPAPVRENYLNTPAIIKRLGGGN